MSFLSLWKNLVKVKFLLSVEGMPRVLGDIIISLAKAKEQAEDYGHSSLSENLDFYPFMDFFICLGMIMK